MPVGVRRDPYRAYNFLVELDGITRAAFRECTGLESATEHAVILRWTTNTGRGPVVHYGVVQYGTDPKNLSQVAAAPPSPSGKRRTVLKWRVPASQVSIGAASLVLPV